MNIREAIQTIEDHRGAELARFFGEAEGDRLADLCRRVQEAAGDPWARFADLVPDAALAFGAAVQVRDLVGLGAISAAVARAVEWPHDFPFRGSVS